MTSLLTKTDNGAPSLTTTLSSALDFDFNGLVRREQLGQAEYNYFLKAVLDNPRLTFAQILQARDVRQGKQEKTVARGNLYFLRNILLRLGHTDEYLLALQIFVRHGCWQDVNHLATAAMSIGPSTGRPLPEVVFFANQLRRDLEQLDALSQSEGKPVPMADEEPEPTQGYVSLAAKWAPTTKRFRAVARAIARLLFPQHKAPDAMYRKGISRLRTHLVVLEKRLCDPDLDYSTLDLAKDFTSRSMRKYRRLLRQKCPKKMEDFLDRVKQARESGSKKGPKVKVVGLQPVEVIQQIMGLEYGPRMHDSEVALLEEQWQGILLKIKRDCLSGKSPTPLTPERNEESKKSDSDMAGTTAEEPVVHAIESSLAMVDVSGSMEGKPMEVAISLGLIISELNQGIFHSMMIPFHENPSWFKVKGASLEERVNNVKKMEWGGSTNLYKAFEMVVDRVMLQPEDARQDAVPHTMYIFSDMQFNTALVQNRSSRATYSTLYQQVKRELFEPNGLTAPQIVFWNVRGSLTFPEAGDTPGVVLLSGYSANLLKSVLSLGSGQEQVTACSVMLESVKKYADALPDNFLDCLANLPSHVLVDPSNVASYSEGRKTHFYKTEQGRQKRKRTLGGGGGGW